MLFTELVLLCNLLGVITHFREGKHLINAENEGIYIQVPVKPKDSKPKHSIADDNNENYSHIRKIVYENFYIDDFFEATDDIDTAVKTIEDIRHVLQRRKLQLDEVDNYGS